MNQHEVRKSMEEAPVQFFHCKMALLTQTTSQDGTYVVWAIKEPDCYTLILNHSYINLVYKLNNSKVKDSKNIRVYIFFTIFDFTLFNKFYSFVRNFQKQSAFLCKKRTVQIYVILLKNIYVDRSSIESVCKRAKSTHKFRNLF